MAATRIWTFDALKGLAVLVMVQTHVALTLKPEIRASEVFRWVDFVDGWVAPCFLFTAGISSVLSGRGSSPQASRKTMLRIAAIACWAWLLTASWFPVFKESRYWLRLDILHVLAMGLFATRLLQRALPAPSFSAAALGLGVLCLGLAPLADSATGPWGQLLNRHSGSMFPLLPWVGIVLLGSVWGAGLAGASARVQIGSSLAAAGGCGALAMLGKSRWEALYPPHAYFDSNPGYMLVKLATVLLSLVALRGLEWRGPPKGLFSRTLSWFGQNSLAAYVIHLELLSLGWFWPSINQRWSGQLDWAEALALTAAVLADTGLLIPLWKKVAQRLWKLVDERAA